MRAIWMGWETEKIVASWVGVAEWPSFLGFNFHFLDAMDPQGLNSHHV